MKRENPPVQTRGSRSGTNHYLEETTEARCRARLAELEHDIEERLTALERELKERRERAERDEEVEGPGSGRKMLVEMAERLVHGARARAVGDDYFKSHG